MVSCVFPGSFDPVTKGHMDLIQRAASLFDRVTVTVMVNISKKGALSLEDRIRLLENACSDFPNVRVDSWDGLLADYMKKKKERIVIRGVRNTPEFEHELSSACANKMLNGSVETFFIPTDPALAGVSSSAVREIFSFGGDISSFVPEKLIKEIGELLSKNQYSNK